MIVPNVGSFKIIDSQLLGKILNYLDSDDLHKLSEASSEMRELVDQALKKVPFIPRDILDSKVKKRIKCLFNRSEEFSCWFQQPLPLCESERKWRNLRDFLLHGSQLDLLACTRSDWLLMDACFSRLTCRVQEIARQWVEKKGCELVSLSSNFENYRTPKGWTYPMLLAKTGQWGALGKLAKKENPIVFEICDDGETLLTALLLGALKKDEMVIWNLSKRIVEWGGNQKQLGDDRALALAAYLGKWDLVEPLLERGADPCYSTTLPDATVICPFISFLQHNRTKSLNSPRAKSLMDQTPEYGLKCLKKSHHPLTTHLVDEEPDLFLETLALCDQNKKYRHPFSNHKEYPIQLLAESSILDFLYAVRKLTNLGANIDACDDEDESVPFLSRWIKFANEDDPENCETTLRKLVGEFRPVLTTGKTTPIHAACEKNNVGILKVLFESMSREEQIASLTTVFDKDGFTPAMLAATKKGQEISEYVESIIKPEKFNPYALSWSQFEKNKNPEPHLKAICQLYSKEDKTLMEAIAKLESLLKCDFILSEKAALIFAEYSPSFALNYMKNRLDHEHLQEWISKVWCCPSVAQKWTSYYLKSPAESTEWRLMLSKLHGALSLDPQLIAKQLVIGAAHDVDASPILSAWIEKFNGGMPKCLLNLYLNEGGNDKETVALLAKLLSKEELEEIIINLSNSGCPISSEISRTILIHVSTSEIDHHKAALKQAIALFELHNTEDSQDAKALIEREDPKQHK
jgi:hypothetical protein